MLLQISNPFNFYQQFLSAYIQHLIGLEEGRENLPEHSGKLGLLRVYLKNEEDAPAVKADLDKLCPDLPIAYLYAGYFQE